MSGSFRAIGARQQALRTFLVAGAACSGLALVAACSASPESAAPAGSNSRVMHRAANGAAAVPSAQQGGSGVFRSQGGTKLALSTQNIIHTASMTVRVRHVIAAGTAATGDVTAAGGYVASEQEIIPRTKQGVPQINLVLKIPVAQFSPIMKKLGQLGRPLSSSQQAQNVTQQVADVTSRVASAQAGISQLRALLKKAGSVSQLLSVQNEINSQESNLEALLAQQRALAHATSYATVTLVLVGTHRRLVMPPKNAPAGFAAGLRGGWHALGVVVSWVLTALGSALPFLVLVALIGAIAVGGRRRLARRKPPPASEPPAASPS